MEDRLLREEDKEREGDKERERKRRGQREKGTKRERRGQGEKDQGEEVQEGGRSHYMAMKPYRKFMEWRCPYLLQHPKFPFPSLYPPLEHLVFRCPFKTQVCPSDSLV